MLDELGAKAGAGFLASSGSWHRQGAQNFHEAYALHNYRKHRILCILVASGRFHWYVA